MFFKQVDLTAALRPSLQPDEAVLFVQDAVGLYEGYATQYNEKQGAYTDNLIDRRFKIPKYQKGAVYLTSLRACYVDDEEPRRHSVAIELRDVDRYEFQVL